jgi:hypothetical protein
MKSLSKPTIIAILTIVAALSTSAAAATPDGSPDLSNALDYYRLCSNWLPIPHINSNTMSRDEFVQSTLCIGFSKGVFDGVTLADVISPLIQWPKNMTFEQAAMVTFNYVRQHPEEGSYPTVSVMQSALQTAYPIPKAKQ